VTGFLATIAGFSFRFRQLDASTGASDPNDFAVRKHHARQSQPHVHRISPHVVTIANAPLVAGDGQSKLLICPTGQRKYFYPNGWTDFW
jgi:hypothetical protein